MYFGVIFFSYNISYATYILRSMYIYIYSSFPACMYIPVHTNACGRDGHLSHAIVPANCKLKASGAGSQPVKV